MAYLQTDNRTAKYPHLNHRIFMFASPPADRVDNRQATFLGELDGWTDFTINTEINTLSSSAEIRYNPQLTQSRGATEIYALGDNQGNFLTANGGRLLVLREVSTDPLGTQPFQDNPLDYGVFIRIENTDQRTGSENITRTLFQGVVSSWEQDLATQQVIVRVDGMSAIAGRKLAADQIFQTALPEIRVNAYDPFTVPEEPNVVNIPVAGEAETPNKYDDYLLIGGNISALRLIDWMFYNNDFCELETNIDIKNATNIVSSEIQQGTLDDYYNDTINARGLTPLIATKLADKDVNTLLTEVWEYVAPDWFFRVEYDDSQKTPNPGTTYFENRYRPKFIMSKGAVWEGTTENPEAARYVADYTLRAGVHITSQSLNFSGENHYTRVIAASKPQGQLRITSLNRPGSTTPYTIEQSSEDVQWEETDLVEDQLDAAGNPIQVDGETLTLTTRSRVISPATEYSPRVVEEFPNSRDRVSGVPYTHPGAEQFINKRRQVVDFTYTKTAPIIEDDANLPSAITELERQIDDKNAFIAEARAEIERLQTEPPTEAPTQPDPTIVLPDTITPDVPQPPVLPPQPPAPPTAPPTTPQPGANTALINSARREIARQRAAITRWRRTLSGVREQLTTARANRDFNRSYITWLTGRPVGYFAQPRTFSVPGVARIELRGYAGSDSARGHSLVLSALLRNANREFNDAQRIVSELEAVAETITDRRIPEAEAEITRQQGIIRRAGGTP